MEGWQEERVRGAVLHQWRQIQVTDVLKYSIIQFILIQIRTSHYYMLLFTASAHVFISNFCRMKSLCSPLPCALFSLLANICSRLSRVLNNYSGMWEDDKASGHGSLEYSNGDRYEGEWENDQRNGNDLPRTALPRHALLCHALPSPTLFCLSVYVDISSRYFLRKWRRLLSFTVASMCLRECVHVGVGVDVGLRERKELSDGSNFQSGIPLTDTAQMTCLPSFSLSSSLPAFMYSLLHFHSICIRRWEVYIQRNGDNLCGVLVRRLKARTGHPIL